MAQQIPLPQDAIAEWIGHHEARRDHTREVAHDVAYRRLAIVNVAFIGDPSGNWVLVDAGVAGTRRMIEGAARERFSGRKPGAILLTHGHFDHVGGLEELAEEWDVPVYAHRLEHPYLSGGASYPPGEPKVGGGMMAAAAGLYPTRPVNVGPRLRALPEDGSLPFLPGWRWIHTPGHSVGHVSFWREADRLLVAGDAFISTAQESAYAVAMQEPEMHGPPMYFTTDWDAARESVRRLAALAPETVLTGHGQPMSGAAMRDALTLLAESFERIAVPKESRYLARPATVTDGSAYREP
jgi:glyoxylase-like metal-dependent hydrolase (beta-lactamase superfamily II)